MIGISLQKLPKYRTFLKRGEVASELGYLNRIRENELLLFLAAAKKEKYTIPVYVEDFYKAYLLKAREILEETEVSPRQTFIYFRYVYCTYMQFIQDVDIIRLRLSLSKHCQAW